MTDTSTLQNGASVVSHPHTVSIEQAILSATNRISSQELTDATASRQTSKNTSFQVVPDLHVPIDSQATKNPDSSPSAKDETSKKVEVKEQATKSTPTQSDVTWPAPTTQDYYANSSLKVLLHSFSGHPKIGVSCTKLRCFAQ